MRLYIRFLIKFIKFPKFQNLVSAGKQLDNWHLEKTLGDILYCEDVIMLYHEDVLVFLNLIIIQVNVIVLQDVCILFVYCEYVGLWESCCRFGKTNVAVMKLIYTVPRRHLFTIGATIFLFHYFASLNLDPRLFLWLYKVFEMLL